MILVGIYVSILMNRSSALRYQKMPVGCCTNMAIVGLWCKRVPSVLKFRQLCELAPSELVMRIRIVRATGQCW